MLKKILFATVLMLLLASGTLLLMVQPSHSTASVEITKVVLHRINGDEHEWVIEAWINNSGTSNVTDLQVEFGKIALIDNGVIVEKSIGNTTCPGPIPPDSVVKAQAPVTRDGEDIQVWARLPQYGVYTQQPFDCDLVDIRNPDPPPPPVEPHIELRYPVELNTSVTARIADALLLNPPFGRWNIAVNPITDEKYSNGTSQGDVDTSYGESTSYGYETTDSVTVETTACWGYEAGNFGYTQEITSAFTREISRSHQTFESIIGHLFPGDVLNEHHFVVWHREKYTIFQYQAYWVTSGGSTHVGSVVLGVPSERLHSVGVSTVEVYNYFNGDHPDIHVDHHMIGDVLSYVNKTYLSDVTAEDIWEISYSEGILVEVGPVEWSYQTDDGYSRSTATTKGTTLTLQSEIGGLSVEGAVSVSETKTHTVSISEGTEFGGTAGVVVTPTWWYHYKPFIYWATPSGSQESFLVVDYYVTSYSPAYDGPRVQLPPPTIDNKPPVAEAGRNQTVLNGTSIEFDGSKSYDPNDPIVDYQWFFGDGNCASGVSVNHTYSEPGSWNVTLVAVDENGAADADWVVAYVAEGSWGAPWDINGPTAWFADGKCDMRDVGLVARYFGQEVPPAPAICDLTGPTTSVPDGKVDMRDVGLVCRHFGQTFP